MPITPSLLLWTLKIFSPDFCRNQSNLSFMDAEESFYLISDFFCRNQSNPSFMDTQESFYLIGKWSDQPPCMPGWADADQILKSKSKCKKSKAGNGSNRNVRYECRLCGDVFCFGCIGSHSSWKIKIQSFWTWYSKRPYQWSDQIIIYYKQNLETLKIDIFEKCVYYRTIEKRTKCLRWKIWSKGSFENHEDMLYVFIHFIQTMWYARRQNYWFFCQKFPKIIEITRDKTVIF